MRLLPECADDLSCRCTLDRFDEVQGAAMTCSARGQHRNDLLRLDVIRTRNLGCPVEDVIGRSIQYVHASKRNPLPVRLGFDAGLAIELLQQR